MHARALLWAVIAITAAAPLLIGSVHPSVQLLLSGGMLVVTAAAIIGWRKSGVRFSSFVAPIVAAIAWTTIQLVPLPSKLVALISPTAAQTRSFLGTSAMMPLTLDAPATVLELVKGMLLLGVLVTVSTLARNGGRARRLLLSIAIVSAGVAMLLLVQHWLKLTDVLGYHPSALPGGGVAGTFVNGNHASSFLELGCVIAIGLAAEYRSACRIALGSLAAVCALAVAVTGSRAGIITLAVAGLAIGTLLALRVRARRTHVLLVAAVVLAAVSLATLNSRTTFAPSPRDSQKVRGWSDALSLAMSAPLSGVGRGAFESAVNRVRHADEGVQLVYPENIIVQIASEWGFVVALLLMGLFLNDARQLAPWLTRVEPSICTTAIGVCAVIAHEFADFGLEFPGVAVPTVVALGVVVARVDEHSVSKRPRRRRLFMRASVPVLVTWAIVIGAGVWAAPRTLRADWQRCQAAVRDSSRQVGEQLTDAMTRHPAADQFHLLAARLQLDKGNLGSALHELNIAIELHPAGNQAHHLAARALANSRRYDQAAIEFRLAAERGASFAPEYLLRVLGTHARRAIADNPDAVFALARAALGAKMSSFAVSLGAEAVEMSGGSEASMHEQLQIAMGANAKEVVIKTATALLQRQPAPESIVVAASALYGAGMAMPADEALKAGIAAHPHDATFLIRVAELKAARGELGNAIVLVGTARHFASTLKERRAVEHTAAELADRAGDWEGAALARDRERIFERTDASFHAEPMR